jgi:hypothetical protein
MDIKLGEFHGRELADPLHPFPSTILSAPAFFLSRGAKHFCLPHQLPGRRWRPPCCHFQVRHAISALTTVGSACMRVPVYISELKLHRVTSRWIHARLRAPTVVYWAYAVINQTFLEKFRSLLTGGTLVWVLKNQNYIVTKSKLKITKSVSLQTQ